MLDQGILCRIKVFCVGSRYFVLDQGILCRIKLLCAGSGYFV